MQRRLARTVRHCPNCNAQSRRIPQSPSAWRDAALTNREDIRRRVNKKECEGERHGDAMIDWRAREETKREWVDVAINRSLTKPLTNFLCRDRDSPLAPTHSDTPSFSFFVRRLLASAFFVLYYYFVFYILYLFSVTRLHYFWIFFNQSPSSISHYLYYFFIVIILDFISSLNIFNVLLSPHLKGSFHRSFFIFYLRVIM